MKKLIRKINPKKIHKGLLLYRLSQQLPIHKNLVLFESFLGRGYSDNPKALYQKMQARYPHLKLVWIFAEEPSLKIKQSCPDWIVRNSPKYYYYMARAKYWIFNTRHPRNLKKRSETIYLQTWHGTPLKRLGLDMAEVHMAGTNTEQYKKNFYEQAQEWDYLISPNQYSSEIFRRAFGFERTLLETGYPRNDILYTKDNGQLAQDIKQKLNLPSNKKIILYAPTWRDDEYITKGQYNFNLKLDLKKMQQRLGKDYIVLLRMHYLIAENMDIRSLEDFAYDVSGYGDIAELYLISDLLITDYSSVFFDYAHLKRPMLFFTYDLEKYTSYLRGFYFDFESVVPGPLIKESDQVIAYIEELENNTHQYKETYEHFLEKFCNLDDGNASDRVLDHLFSESKVPS